MKWTQVFTVVALYAAVASPRAIRSPTQDALAPVPASLTSYPSFPSAALFVDKPTAGGAVDLSSTRPTPAMAQADQGAGETAPVITPTACLPASLGKRQGYYNWKPDTVTVTQISFVSMTSTVTVYTSTNIEKIYKIVTSTESEVIWTQQHIVTVTNTDDRAHVVTIEKPVTVSVTPPPVTVTVTQDKIFPMPTTQLLIQTQTDVVMQTLSVDRVFTQDKPVFLTQTMPPSQPQKWPPS